MVIRLVSEPFCRFKILKTYAGIKSVFDSLGYYHSCNILPSLSFKSQFFPAVLIPGGSFLPAFSQDGLGYAVGMTGKAQELEPSKISFSLPLRGHFRPVGDSSHLCQHGLLLPTHHRKAAPLKWSFFLPGKGFFALKDSCFM